MIENRAFGIETEFSAHVTYGPNGMRMPIGRIINHYRQTSHETGSSEEPPIRWLKDFASNGSRFYLDVGDHPEYATPPTTSLTELSALTIAGERIVYAAFQRATALADSNIKSFSLNNRVIGKDGETWGRHENHLIDLRHVNVKDPQETPAAFAFIGAHLATRSVYTGAGGLLHGKFIVAQKATTVEDYMSVYTTQYKPLVNTRNHAPRTGNHPFLARLHVITADPHMNPWGDKMSVGSTNIILSMIEDGMPIPAGARMSPEQMPEITRMVAHDTTAQKPLYLSDGTRTNATLVQRAIYDQALRWVRDIGRAPTPDEQFVLEQWDRTTHMLDREGVYSLQDRVEWIGKMALYPGLLNKLNQRRSLDNENNRHTPDYIDKPAITMDSSEMDERDLQFDRIGTQGSIGERLRETRWQQWMPPKELIKQRMSVAPPGRGEAIGAFILEHGSNGTGNNETFRRHAGWDYTAAILPGEGYRQIYYGDPRSTDETSRRHEYLDS